MYNFRFMTLQSGNKSHTKLFPLHWSCLARSRWCSDSERPLYPLSSLPPSQCEHSHATPSQIQLPSPFRRSRYLPQGQSSRGSSSSRHCTLSCAQIRNPNPNPFSINDAQTDARPTSDLRAQARSPSILRSFSVPNSALSAVFIVAPLARALGSLSAIAAAAYDSAVLPPFCWLALAARTRRGFVALFRLFPFVVFELSALLVWHPLHKDTHTYMNIHTHEHTLSC